MGKQVRHAVVRSTGATTLAHKVGDEWVVECLNHRAKTTADSRSAAWRTAARPESFCAKCEAITKGKAERITDGRLDIPKERPAAKKTTKAPAKKQPAKRVPPAKRVAEAAA